MVMELETECRPAENGHVQPVRKFTWEELSRLNQRHNAHVAVRGKVYDVSGFIERHPGGVDQLMLGAGRDVTILFESYHDFNVSKVLGKYYVGELVSNELPVFPEPNAFHRTVKDRVQKYFKENTIDPKISYWMFLRYAVIFFLGNALWIATIYFHDSPMWVSVLLTSAWGFCLSQFLMAASHDISHFAVTHKPWVWKLFGAVSDCVTGISMHVWTYEHVMAHHVYTNIHQVDPDVFTSNNPPDLRRIHVSQKWLPRYNYQHVYLIFLYCVVGMKKRVKDFFIVYNLRKKSMRLNPLSRSQLAIFILGKCVYISYYLLLPCLFMHWAFVLMLVVLGDFIAWYWLITITQLTHVSADVIWPRPNEDNIIDMDWAEMQVATGQDYATDSTFWNVTSGALNNQIAHHLFPGVIQHHYPGVSRVVMETCQEFGITFRYAPTAWEAFKLHIAFLRQLGQEKKSN